MEYQASKSDIDFEFDSSDSDSDDVSISTNPSEPESPFKRYGVRGIAQRFEKASLQEKEDGDNDFLNGIGDDGSDGGSNISIGSEELMSPRANARANGSNGADKRNRRRVPDEFGPPVVIPLKTDCLGDDKEPIDTGTRNFNRRPPPRTKSGEGMTSSAHSAASGRRRPPPRTKSGEGIVKNDDSNVSNHRRRPPPRTKSGSADGICRRPPARTKSGGNIPGNNEGENENHESVYYEEKLPDHDSSGDDVSPTSPLSRQQSEEYRELALQRNSARRQRSSDMLGAMREATRNLPARSKSTNLMNARRRGPGRTKSGGLLALSGSSTDELASPGRKPLRRKAPPRTKSGGGQLFAAPPLET